MSQNIDAFLEKIKFNGINQLDINQVIDLKMLQFANSKLFRRKMPTMNEIKIFNSKAMSVATNQQCIEIISDLGLLIKQCQFDNVRTRVVLDFILAQEIRENNLNLNTCQLNYVTKQSLNHQSNKEQVVRQIYSFINWILLHQQGDQTLNINVAHLSVFEVFPSTLVIVVGYNDEDSELYMALENFRYFNYSRNSIQNIPKYRYELLCSIIYHFVSLIRKMLKFSDTRRYDIELKQILSANASHLIESPDKSKNLPQLGQFNECEFQLFNLNLSFQDINKSLQDYRIRKNLICQILKQLNCLYVSTPNDMAYAFVLSNSNLLCAFQYNSAHTFVQQQNKQKIIQDIYNICDQEYFISQITQKKPIRIETQQTPQSINKNQQISQLIQTSMSTAFQWFDSSRYSKVLNTERSFASRSLTPNKQKIY